MKSIFTIYAKTNNTNSATYANSNRFIRSFVVAGEEALTAKLAELKSAGVEIDSVYNRIGKKISF